MNRWHFTVAILLGIGLAFATFVQAQDYPTKPIRLLTAGAGCLQLEPHYVNCPGPISVIGVGSGGGDDVVDLTAVALPGFVLGGEGSVMGDELFYRYERVALLQPGWRRELDAAGVDYVVFDRGSTLDDALATQPDWRQVYRDSTAVIYVRSGTGPDQAG